MSYYSHNAGQPAIDRHPKDEEVVLTMESSIKHSAVASLLSMS
jgi:hypothetical protein